MPVILGGNTGIYLASLTPAVDPDAQAFITAAAITDPTQQAAINQLVVDLKGYSIWSKMKALYPFVGGTATSHKFNLKNPLDTDAAFRLVFNGGWTHSSTGALPNGTNAYADTVFNPSTNFNTSTFNHLSYYSRTNSAIASEYVMGIYDGTSTNALICRRDTNLSFFVADYPSGTSYRSASGSVTDGRGLFLGTQTGANAKLFRNGSVIYSNTGATLNNAIANQRLYIGVLNNTTTIEDTWTDKECAFASIGEGLSDTEAANFYTAVQAFQTTIGRSIGTQTVSDADAQAFVTNAGIVDQVEANAINNLVIGLKADGLWTKMKAVYPFVGGTASTMKFNLKNPLNTDAAFRLGFVGGGNWSNTGYTPNGTNGYAGTFIYMSANLSATNLHTAYYSRTNVANNSQFDCGVTDNTTKGWLIMRARTAAGNATLENGSASFNGAVANSQGLYIGTSTASNAHKIYKNGLVVASSTTAQAQTLFTEPQFFGAALITTGGAYYSTRELAFASVGTGLNDTDAANLNTRVTTFQTALNRQVP
jgi:hypothetical protein